MDKRLLIDTNIVLEVILDQENSYIASKILDSEIQLSITSISLVSIFIICRKYKVPEEAMKIFYKMLISRLDLIEFHTEDLLKVFSLSLNKNLDFDDAHIYFYAKKNKFKILTFDKHLLKYPDIAVDARYV